MTTRLALQAAGMLELAEAVCAHYGTTLDVALTMTHWCKVPHVRHTIQVLYAVLYTLGWSQARIAKVFGCGHVTVGRAIDTVLMSEVRRFVPRKAAA